MRYVKSLIKLLLSLFILSIIGLGLMFIIMRTSMPTSGKDGKEADAFAKSVQNSVQRSAWARTGAIKWSMFNRQYLWDLRRGLVRVKIENNDVYFDIQRRRNIVRRGKKTLSGSNAERIASEAYAHYIKDRFILEPTQSFFDSQVRRFIVNPDTPEASLFVHYGAGGLTPKDSFQWFMNENTGLPSGVRLWADLIPVSGVMVIFANWKELKTGLKISTLRTVGPLTINIDVKADTSLTQLMGRKDPFSFIEPDPFEPTPTSQPSVFAGSDSLEFF
jgi:hypothetical protein